MYTNIVLTRYEPSHCDNNTGFGPFAENFSKISPENVWEKNGISRKSNPLAYIDIIYICVCISVKYIIYAQRDVRSI